MLFQLKSKMKKLTLILAAMFLAASLLSCGKENAGSAGGDGQKAVSTKVEVKLTAQFNYDFFLYADYQVKCTSGGNVETFTLQKPQENSRSQWSKNLEFISEDEVIFEVICTPKTGVTYETHTKTVGSKTVEYVFFNTNFYVGMEMMDYDASGKALYKDFYGSRMKEENKGADGEVSDAHGFGADDLNYASLRTEIQDGKSIFEARQLKSYRFHYKIVKGADGLTAESVRADD